MSRGTVCIKKNIQKSSNWWIRGKTRSINCERRGVKMATQATEDNSLGGEALQSAMHGLSAMRTDWKLAMRICFFLAQNGTHLSARCHFTGPKKLSISRAQPPPTCPSNGCCPHQKHYARGRINHRYINSYSLSSIYYAYSLGRCISCLTWSELRGANY